MSRAAVPATERFIIEDGTRSRGYSPGTGNPHQWGVSKRETTVYETATGMKIQPTIDDSDEERLRVRSRGNGHFVCVYAYEAVSKRSACIFPIEIDLFDGCHPLSTDRPAVPHPPRFSRRFRHELGWVSIFKLKILLIRDKNTDPRIVVSRNPSTGRIPQCVASRANDTRWLCKPEIVHIALGNLAPAKDRSDRAYGRP